MDTEESIKKIIEIIDEMRPLFQADGGDITFQSIDGERVYVALGGNCAHCGATFQTLGLIRRKVIQETGQHFLVVPASG
jgi:NifU-like protein